MSIVRRLFGRNGDGLAGMHVSDTGEEGDKRRDLVDQVEAASPTPAPLDARQPAGESTGERLTASDTDETLPKPVVPPTGVQPEDGDEHPATGETAEEREDVEGSVSPPSGVEQAVPDTSNRAPAVEVPPAEPAGAGIQDERVVDVASAAGVVESDQEPVADSASSLAAETVVAGRYQMVDSLTAEQASALLGVPVAAGDADLYVVEDVRGHERCWSCGSAANAEGQRFCVDCGAQLQHHQLVLARTKNPTGDADEFVEDGIFYHLVLPRKQFGSTGISLEVGAHSLEGPHQPNEDSYWVAVAGGTFDSVSQMVGVLVLADGMGGYAPGSGLISREVVTIAGRHMFAALLDTLPEDAPETDVRAVVRSAIREANTTVLTRIAAQGEMGSTFLAAVCHGATAFLANIGDSRAYYIAPSGAVSQITRDQSLVEAQVAAGLLSPEDAYTVMGNNVILHAIGEEGVEDAFDWYVQPLEPGGRLILCSDGYWKTMRHDVWNPEAAQQHATLAGLARALAEDALAHNTDDNTTVVLIGID